MSERDAFEAWYLRNVCDRLPYFPGRPGHDYYVADTDHGSAANDMWDAWQAATAHAAKVCAELHGLQTVNNQEYPRAWHDGVTACEQAILGMGEK